jgi:hypothetical protein
MKCESNLSIRGFKVSFVSHRVQPLKQILAPFTMGRSIQKNSYHQATIRTSLTRNLHRCFPDVRDEIVCAFDDVLSLQGTGAAIHLHTWEKL